MLWNGLNFCRRVVMNFLFVIFVLILIGISALFSGEKSDVPMVQGALRLNLDGFLADNREPNSELKALLNNFQQQTMPEQISTFDVIYAIDQAAKDQRITGIVLDLNNFLGGDLPSLTAIGNSLVQFKQSGKPVFAVADNYSQKQYILASYADRIFLHQQGQVQLAGLGGKQFYYKSLLDKIDAQPHVFRVGTYKAAVEPLLRDDMSPEARQNAQQWLGEMWQNIQTLVSSNRQQTVEQLFPQPAVFLQQVKAVHGDLTSYALEKKLVNVAASRYQIEQQLKDQFGTDQDNQYQHIDFSAYLSTLNDYEQDRSQPYNVAIVRVEGAIIDGESDEENVGGDTIADLLRQAADDDQVKAVVLRINSPGGSASAAEVIREEVDHLQALGKPVVVSMGGMAASGGYWIASTADYIVADENTITGSIGIFAAFVTLEKSLQNLGIHSDGVQTSPLAGGLSPFTPLSQEMGDVIQLSIEHGYDQFISLVAQGRNLDKQVVDSLAQGRVWLGEQALQHKLVDQLGGLDEAIKVAFDKIDQQEKAKGEKSSTAGVIWLSPEQDRGVLSLLSKNTKVQQYLAQIFGLEALLPAQQIQQQLGLLTQFTDPNGRYLYCLNCQSLY